MFHFFVFLDSFFIQLLHLTNQICIRISYKFFLFLIRNEYMIFAVNLCKVDLLHYIWTILSSSSISLPVSLFPFSKIWIYLQNIPRDAFLFRLRIGTVYHGENFLITKTSNSWIKQDLKNTEDAIEHSNQTNSFSLTINATYDFALSWWPRWFADWFVFLLAFFNLSNWLQYFTELMVSPWEKNS